MACSIEKWNLYAHSWEHFGGVNVVRGCLGSRATYVNAHDDLTQNCTSFRLEPLRHCQ